MELLSLEKFKAFKAALRSKKESARFMDLKYYWLSDEYANDKNYAWNGSLASSRNGWDSKKIKLQFLCSPKNNSSSMLNIVFRFALLKELKQKDLLKPSVQLEISKHQFEKTVDFEKRVEDARKTNQKAIEIYKEQYVKFLPKAKEQAMQQALEILYGKPIVSGLSYDADNEIFGAKLSFENNKNFMQDLAIKIKSNEAQKFYENFQNITPIALFDFDGQNVGLQGVRFDFAQNKYFALFSDKSLIQNTQQIAKLENQAFEATAFFDSISIVQNQQNNFDTSNIITTNDLENLLAKTTQLKQDPKKWAFIVGVENYKYTDNVVFAKRSAEMFAKVANKTLGVPQENTFLLVNENATAAEIKNKLKLFMRNIDKDDEIYFYYNGHGIPAADKENEPFILSADMMPDFVSEEPFFMLKQIYSELSLSKASSVIAIVDSCFTGTTDGKSIQKGVAATKMKPKGVDFDKSKMAVITAGKDNQYSNAYNQKAHRLFSFFVMQELIKGEKNIKQLYEKVYRQTKDTTMKNYGHTRLQEPQIDGNEKLEL